MHDEHGDGYETAEDGVGVQKFEQRRAVVENPEVVIEVEGNALQHIADRHAEDQRGNEAADKERPVPAGAPCGAFTLGAIFETDRTQDQRKQGGEHRQVKT
ncbi:hypothetical protein D3C78_1103170 [compost metagenome]